MGGRLRHGLRAKGAHASRASRSPGRSRSARRSLVVLAVAALVMMAAVAAPTASATPAAATVVGSPPGEGADAGNSGTVETSVGRYVALGDSYTSGPFVPWQRTDPLGCARSTHNYPAELAATLAPSTYVDVSCAGADTSHMHNAQDVPLGSNPPQLDALSADTDLVTIGIGGNDESLFGDLVGVCSSVRELDPTGTPCEDHFTDDGTDDMAERIAATRDRLEQALQRIADRAPDATVAVVGYPRIVPTEGTCPDVLPFADGDYAFLDRVERELNTALAEAAASVDATYVDTYAPSQGHDACAENAWVQGQQLEVFTAAPYHPNAAGMAGIASIVADTLAGDTVDIQRAERRATGAQAAAEARVDLAKDRRAGGAATPALRAHRDLAHHWPTAVR